jgi:ADP-ribose pyrophosphatase
MEYCKSSSRVYDGRIINLRVDQVLLDDGGSTTREIVEHRGAAAIIPLIDDDRVILVRQYRYAVTEGLLEVPAGTLEPQETPEDCARRELEEETGYTCREVKKILECFVAPGYSTEKIHFYLARGLVLSEPKTEADEHITSEVMPISQALEKVRLGEIRDAKTICALFRAQDFLQTTKPP